MPRCHPARHTRDAPGARSTTRARLGAWARTAAVAAALLAAGPSHGQQAGVIATVAGTGQAGFSGDGALAMAATFDFVDKSGNTGAGLAVDVHGNVYAADFANGRIRRISRTGIIDTVAGGGMKPGTTADGGAATDAVLEGPSSVAFDAAGNLYITEVNGNRVRMVDPSGRIRTMAGTGMAGYSGDGGLATQAALYGPIYSAVDRAGDVFIADMLNARIRKVDPRGIISTAAGGGDLAGALADGGPATKARLGFEQNYRGVFGCSNAGIAVDGAGNLFISEVGGGGQQLANAVAPLGRVRKVSPDGTISTFAGAKADNAVGVEEGIPANEVNLECMGAVAADSAGNVFVGNHDTHSVRKIDTTGRVTTVAGNGQFPDPMKSIGDGGPAIQATLGGPEGLAIDSEGNLFIGDDGGERVREVYGAAAPGLLAGSALPPLPPPGPSPPGDLNADGTVTVADAVIALRAVIGAMILSLDQATLADVNGDGKIDLRDVTLILKTAIGL